MAETTAHIKDDESIVTEDTPVTEGLEYWLKQREEWTGGHSSAPVESPNSNNPALREIVPDNYLKIYTHLVRNRRKLSKPIPLSFTIKILVAGWKADGTWPTEENVNKSSIQENTRK
ncbi:7717_t:CDS:2 [Paraglomus brasilianum]|uniref:7717_t:CDS:1 n=1 Tax=Paraglomus brasilianum TaxID=144538 RepID=A0A9N9GIE1_9GLOM|nr:7717_t:CDS:2 [Paraglomus brasilianum]